MVRELEAGVPDRGSHTIAALADGRIGQSHHREVGQPERDIDLDVNGIRFDAKDSGTAQAREHDACRVQEMVPRAYARDFLACERVLCADMSGRAIHGERGGDGFCVPPRLDG